MLDIPTLSVVLIIRSRRSDYKSLIFFDVAVIHLNVKVSRIASIYEVQNSLLKTSCFRKTDEIIITS